MDAPTAAAARRLLLPLRPVPPASLDPGRGDGSVPPRRARRWTAPRSSSTRSPPAGRVTRRRATTRRWGSSYSLFRGCGPSSSAPSSPRSPGSIPALRPLLPSSLPLRHRLRPPPPMSYMCGYGPPRPAAFHSCTALGSERRITSTPRAHQVQALELPCTLDPPAWRSMASPPGRVRAAGSMAPSPAPPPPSRAHVYGSRRLKATAGSLEALIQWGRGRSGVVVAVSVARRTGSKGGGRRIHSLKQKSGEHLESHASK